MALAGLGVSLLGAGLGAALGGSASEKTPKYVDTNKNTTTTFLDPAQLSQILNGLTKAENTARGDISSGIAEALSVLTGDTNAIMRNSAIQNQAVQNKLLERSGGEDPNAFLESLFMRRYGQDKNNINYLKKTGRYDERLDKFKQDYIDKLNITDQERIAAENQVRLQNSELFSTQSSTDAIDPYLRSTQALNLSALNQMAAMSGLAGSDGQVAMSPEQIQERLMQTPGYQFRYNEGMRGVERSNAARGLLESGAILKGLTEFGQGLASQEFGAEHARLASLAGQTMNPALQGASQQQQNTMAQAELLAGQGSQLANIATQAAQQRGNALLQGGLNTNRQVQSQLMRV